MPGPLLDCGVLGAGSLLLVGPGVAQEGRYLAHSCRPGALVQRWPVLGRIAVVGEVSRVQLAGGQAAEERLRFGECGLRVGASHES